MDRAVCSGGREHAAAVAPVRAVGLYLLLGVLAFVAVSYLDTGAPRTAVGLAMLGPFAIAVWRPVVGAALLLAAAPLADPIAAYLVTGSPVSRDTGGIIWVEPMFLGVAAGITTRLLGGRVRRTATPASWCYVAIVLCAFGVQLAGYARRWQGLTYQPLETLWTSIPDPSQFSPGHTARATLVLLLSPLSLWLVRNAVDEPERERPVWLAWTGGAVVVTACAVAMWIYGFGFTERGDRFAPFLDDSNSYASYLLLTVFVGWAVLWSEGGAAARVLGAIVVVSSVCLIVLSGSKVAVLAVVACVAVAAFSMPKRRWLGVLLAGFVLTTLWSGAMVAARYMRSDVRSIGDPSYVVRYLRENRWSVWTASARAFVAYPAAGIGPGLLSRNLDDFYRPEDQYWRPRVENAHNYFLQLAAETGVFGPLAFAWMVVASLRPALTDRSPRGGRGRLLAIGGLGYLATLITGHALLLSTHAILFWGFLGALSAPYESPPSRGRGRYAGWLAVPLFLAALWLDRAPHDCHPAAPGSGVLSWEFGLGFHALEKIPGSRQRWMTDAGEFRICNPADRPLVADVGFAVQSFDERRTLSVYSGDELVADVAIGPNAGTFMVPDVALAPGLTALHFIATPGARRVDDLLHNGDRRSVSVLFVGGPRFAHPETGEPLRSSGLPR